MPSQQDQATGNMQKLVSSATQLSSYASRHTDTQTHKTYLSQYFATLLW